MRRFASMSTMDVWYSRIEVADILPEIQSRVAPTRAQLLVKALTKMRARDSVHAFTKLTERIDGEVRIRPQPPLIVPLADLLDDEQRAIMQDALTGMVRSYARTLQTDRRHLLDRFRVVDMARKVVGVGSVGTRAWILLLTGRETSEPLFLQAKEAEASVVERFAGQSRFANHGQRVVAGQRVMQASSDIFLGWDRTVGIDGRKRDFYVRQFRDWKGAIEIQSLLPEGLGMYARYCGWTLARAHARSGDRIAIASYLGKSGVFDEAIAEFAARYADQNERDFEALLAAIEEGRIESEPGV
jgi:uncharacterized protein (DUF2252 family)